MRLMASGVNDPAGGSDKTKVERFPFRLVADLSVPMKRYFFCSPPWVQQRVVAGERAETLFFRPIAIVRLSPGPLSLG
jgi:hypothetical protein